jgi:hypothetical protein
LALAIACTVTATAGLVPEAVLRRLTARVVKPTERT